MRRALWILVPLLVYSSAFAAPLTVPPVPAIGTSCVKAKFRGNATTYNPNYGGWKTGGQKLATGGTYNPNGWEAALQLGLAKQYGCGYGSGRVCHAAVEVPQTGRAAIVVINDNGPMCADEATANRAPDCKNEYSRVIDLNEKAMRYLSAERYGKNSGVLYDVTVTLLCAHGDFLGPLDPRDREAWKGVIDDTAYTRPIPTGGSPSPFGVGQQIGAFPRQGAFVGFGPAGGSGQNLGQFGGGAMVPGGTTMSPLLVSPSPGGGNKPVAELSALTILAQPRTARPKQNVIVSWTSINMQPHSCVVQVKDSEFATGNEATKTYAVPTGATGLIEFSLECTTQSGEKRHATSTISIL